MLISAINNDTRASGNLTFRRYMAALICGPTAAETFQRGMFRYGGISEVPGIIDALIDVGICDRDDVIAAAARTSRCRSTSISDIIDALAGADASKHLWFERGGKLQPHKQATADNLPRFLLAG
jgi:hypothetical protein